MVMGWVRERYGLRGLRAVLGMFLGSVGVFLGGLVFSVSISISEIVFLATCGFDGGFQICFAGVCMVGGFKGQQGAFPCDS